MEKILDCIKKKKLIVSVIIITAIVAIIIGLSYHGGSKKKNANTKTNIAASDSSKISGLGKKAKKTEPSQISGKYIEESDGWCYSFSYSPINEYDGSFEAGYDKNFTPKDVNETQKNYTAAGYWKLDGNEIKLYSENEYQSSLFISENSIVDTQNFFDGKIPDIRPTFQTVCTSKPVESGDTQVLNFYTDGKFIMEVVRNEENKANDNVNLPSYQMFAGTYTIDGDTVKTDIGSSAQTFHIVEGGIAKWVYTKQE